MSVPALIGLCGHKGSGKSSVAKILHERHNYTRTRFAGPLKKMLRALGLTEREIEGDLKEKPSDILCGKTPRFAMQTLGTEWARDMIGEALWVNAWKAQIELYLPAVAEDCRFANEAQAIRDLGGVIWMVERPGATGDGHASERLEVKPDLVINNSSSLRGLELDIDSLFVKMAA